MFVATMQTEHFAWMAAGETEAEARAAMEQGWANHHLARGVDVLTDEVLPEDIDEYYGIRIHEIKAGQCYRDDTQILDTQ
jgi:hypothetical protein